MEVNGLRDATLPQRREGFVVQPGDIHSLISFTQATQADTGSIFVHERRTPFEDKQEPGKYATKKAWRQAKHLDSLATMCVSQRKEAITTSLRYDNKRLEIIIASNDDIQEKTKEHLHKVWGHTT